jgi:hypothetical protein
MAETNVSAYFASKRRIGTGKALTWKWFCTLLLCTKHTDSIVKVNKNSDGYTLQWNLC